MNPTEAQTCLNELRNSFGRWQPTETELYHWKTLLLAYSLKTGKRAINKLFWEQGKELAPNRKVFRAIISADKSDDSENTGPPPGNAYLICSGVDDAGHGFPGMVSWIGWTSRLVPMSSDPNTAKAIEGLQSVYGGRWVGFCGTGLKAMLKAQQFKRSTV